MELKRLIKKHLHEMNRIVVYDRTAQNQKIRITNHLINNILLCISGTEGVHIPEMRQLNSWDDGRERLGIQTLSFDNGLLMLDDMSGKPVLAKATPWYFTLVKLPYCYVPDATCRMWLKFLDEVMEGDSEYIELLRQ